MALLLWGVPIVDTYEHVVSFEETVYPPQFPPGLVFSGTFVFGANYLVGDEHNSSVFRFLYFCQAASSTTYYFCEGEGMWNLQPFGLIKTISQKIFPSQPDGYHPCAGGMYGDCLLSISIPPIPIPQLSTNLDAWDVANAQLYILIVALIVSASSVGAISTLKCIVRSRWATQDALPLRPPSLAASAVMSTFHQVMAKAAVQDMFNNFAPADFLSKFKHVELSLPFDCNWAGCNLLEMLQERWDKILAADSTAALLDDTSTPLIVFDGTTFTAFFVKQSTPPFATSGLSSGASINALSTSSFSPEPSLAAFLIKDVHLRTNQASPSTSNHSLGFLLPPSAFSAKDVPICATQASSSTSSQSLELPQPPFAFSVQDVHNHAIQPTALRVLVAAPTPGSVNLGGHDFRLPPPPDNNAPELSAQKRMGRPGPEVSVLADGWAPAEPAKTGKHAGKPRWYHSENQ